MTFYIFLIISILLCVGTAIYMGIQTVKIKNLGKVDDRNVKEILKAIKQAEKYSDETGWIAVKFINRDKWMEMR